MASYGEITQTEKILLTGSETAQCTIRLPRGKTNSVLEVLDGAPDVVVGNLDRLFDQQPDQVYTEADRTLVESGGKVEICITVQDSSPAPAAPWKRRYRTPAASGRGSPWRSPWRNPGLKPAALRWAEPNPSPRAICSWRS